jgi:ribosomal protein S18 acetylase RimI-like enzyme
VDIAARASGGEAAIRPVRADEIDALRELWREYQKEADAAICFDGFEKELLALPGDYAPPRGALIGAEHAGALVGAVGLRPLGVDGVCEMKRLYVRPAARKLRLGRALTLAVLDAGRALRYRALRLDTLGKMEAARSLYASLGFRVVEPYHEPPPGLGMVFMEISL